MPAQTQKRIALITAVALLCCSCSSTAPVSRMDYQKISQEEKDLNAAAGNIAIAPGSVAANKLTPAAFTKVGYGVVETECNTYFDKIIKADNGIKQTKADVVALGTAAAVIATLAKTSTQTVGITAAGFGLATAAIDNYEQYAFATPYPLQTWKLVKDALKAYSDASPSSSAQTLEDASELIRGYAILCSYSGIASLSAQAISKGTPVDSGSNTPATPLFTAAQKTTYLDSIDQSLGGVPAGTWTDFDYVILAAIADPATTGGSTLTALASGFSTNVQSATKTGYILNGTTKQPALTPVWLLLKALIAENPTFASRVKTAETTAASGGTPAPQLVRPANIVIQ